MSNEKISVIVILEMLGRPAEHVQETMEEITENLGKEQGITMINKKIQEAKKIEGQELFSLFSEIELELESMQELLVLIFKYMPSHIDIITPENLKVKNSDLNLFSNELIRKLHQYDEIAKTLSIERNVLREQIEKLGETPINIFEKKTEEKPTKKKVKKKPSKKKKN